MGKKQSKNNHSARTGIPQQQSMQPSAGWFGRLAAASGQIAIVASEPVPDWSEAAIMSFFEKLPEADRAGFHEFIEGFARLGTKAKEASLRLDEETARVRDALASREAEITKERHSIELEREQMESERERLEALLAECNARTAEIDEAQQKLDRERSGVAAAKQELITREAAIRGGLVLDREKALAVVQEQVSELEAKRDRLPGEIALLQEQLMDRARRDAHEIIECARREGGSVRERELALAAKLAELEHREARLSQDEAARNAWQRMVREEERADAKALLDERDRALSSKQKEVARLKTVADELQSRVDDFDALISVLGDDPEQALREVQQLRVENRRLDRELQALRDTRSEDDAKQLRVQRDKLQERLEAVQGELFSLRDQQHQWQRSVMERQSAEQMLRILEKHKLLLASSVQELERKVDELTDRQKEATAFPELVRMDAELTRPVVTEPPPPLSSIVRELQQRIAHAEDGKELHFPREILQLFVGGLAMSRLHIFQGISGTGKTSLAVAFARAVGAHCTVIPIQAGWRDRADLIGHYNAFEKRYYEKETLQALYRAQTETERDKLHVVVLDEMNLSRPEQYFAEFLSAMEVSESKRLISLMESKPANGAPALLQDGRMIRLPANVWFIGTANHDETTNAFADKTQDRAFVLELPKQEPGEKIPRPREAATWSFEGLLHEFQSAQRKHGNHVRKLLDQINSSQLTKVLNDEFDLGWGNRLEQQLLRFVPVVMECGGTESLAIDHMLKSRMFRDGKVIGRHDKGADDLRRVEDALVSLWSDCKLGGEPEASLRVLARDVQRLERGA